MLRIAALELPHRFGMPATQLVALDQCLLGLRGEVDLVVMPETALTGYCSPQGACDPTAWAEPLDGPTMAQCASLARDHGIALLAPLVEDAPGPLGPRRYNSAVLFDAEGERVGHWRKRHPWHPEKWATPGDLGTPVVSLRGVRLAVAICFDIHFVADDAAEALAAADVLLYPSAWVDDDAHDARGPLLSQLAQTHGLWVVNANWGLGLPRVRGQGGSRIVDPTGREVVRACATGGARLARATVGSRRHGDN